MQWILSRKSENCAIWWGNLNIDFLRAGDHRATGELLDVLYCSNVFPLITKPTRVTNTTATLIDHILTNNFDNAMMHIQGILCTAISDHCAIFHVANNAKTDHAQTAMPLLKRNMGQRNITTFTTEMNMVDWQVVLNETDTQSAYSKFHEVISTKYNACFPYLYGICGIELKWFENYLSVRMQYVTYNNHKSSHEKIHCGAPQGSILGPILFLLYINDLTSVSEFCFPVLFADDTNMFITGKDMDILCHQLNEDLRNVQEWLQCNKLSLNVLKTHYMIFTPRNKLIDDIDVKIIDVQIQRVYVTKF